MKLISKLNPLTLLILSWHTSRITPFLCNGSQSACVSLIPYISPNNNNRLARRATSTRRALLYSPQTLLPAKALMDCTKHTQLTHILLPASSPVSTSIRSRLPRVTSQVHRNVNTEPTQQQPTTTPSLLLHIDNNNRSAALAGS